MVRILIIIAIFLHISPVRANSCCGQSPASFTVLSLDQKLSLSTTFSVIEAQGRIFNTDEFYIWEQKNRLIQAWQFNIASTWKSQHQFFLNSSYLQSSYKDEVGSGRSSHFSDTLLGYTFEALPEYSFSRWRPLVYTSFFINLPTGKSIYTSPSLNEGTDVTGHDQWGLGLGLTARKVYFPVTLTLQARSIYIFAKTFPLIEVSDFFDSSVAVIVNYSTRFYDFSLNTGLTFAHLSPRTIQTNASNSKSSVSQNVSFLLGLQKPLNETWSLGLNYADQTLLGPAKNTILNRTVSLNLNYNYY